MLSDNFVSLGLRNRAYSGYVLVMDIEDLASSMDGLLRCCLSLGTLGLESFLDAELTHSDCRFKADFY
jgi:hypothetical protein